MVDEGDGLAHWVFNAVVAHALSGSDDGGRKDDAYFGWNRQARIASKQAMGLQVKR